MSVVDLLIGRPLATQEEGQQRVGPLAGIPMLGLDALGSAAYGPEAALTLMIPLGTLGLIYIGPIILLILLLLLIVYFSYRQTIAAYPGGGGSYTVASRNLGVFPGLLAAAALMLDYVLNVAIGISAGVGALVSAVPLLQPYILPLSLAILLLIALVNLRGVRESGLVFMAPTYLFVFSLLAVLALGLVKTVLSGGSPAPVVAPPPLPPVREQASLWLLLQAFASGCTAMTGVEAVSNGVTAFRNPSVLYARRTLTAIIAILAMLLAGIAFLVGAYHIGATVPGEPGYQSILSMLVAAIVGRGLFYYITIGSVLAVLALSANTSFADFPRLSRVVAGDEFLPHNFAQRGRRLVFSNGIFTLTACAAILLIAFGGITDRLIPLFAVGAFMAFTLSQAGMVAHWRRVGGPSAQRSMIVNGVGAVATGLTLAVVIVAKFVHGAWLTVLLIPLLLLVFRSVKKHYEQVSRETLCQVPLDLTSLRPPIVVVPVRGWTTVVRKALRFAVKISPEVYAVQVTTGEDTPSLAPVWERNVEEPCRAAGLPPPHLVVVDSPYRRFFGPLLKYIDELEAANPERQIAVIIPELVEHRWYHYLMHNQRAEVLKALLLFHGRERLVVVNVPWYLKA